MKSDSELLLLDQQKLAKQLNEYLISFLGNECFDRHQRMLNQP
jgi:hypothetical protein